MYSYLHLAWPDYGLDVLNITMHTEVVSVSVQSSGYFQSTVSYVKVQTMFK